jgi:hypothetical protein
MTSTALEIHLVAGIIGAVILRGVPIAAQEPCESAKLLASDAEADSAFGNDVAVHGSLALVGAIQNDDNGENSGAAYLFDLSDPANPIEIARLLADDGGASDYFGSGLGLSGDTAVVGQGSGGAVEAAYVFDISDPFNPLQVATLEASDDSPENDEFGWHNAIDGDTIIVGSHRNADVGAAYLFRDQGGGKWTEVQKLTASDGAASDSFGFSVAISGGFAVVGASHDDDAGNASGSAYVFHEEEDGTWLETHKLTASDAAPTDLFGRSVAIHGDLVVVLAGSAEPAGAAYVFRASTGEELAKVLPEAGDWFANDFEHQVAINGTTAMVGCGSEAAYLFDLTDPVNPVQIARIAASDGGDGDSFGRTVAINGPLALVGAWRDADQGENTGSAYVFAVPGPDVPDCGGNGVPDACEPDCNGNDVPDDCDITSGTSRDCNGNGVPDACDIESGTSLDLDGDAIPDECCLGDTNGDEVVDVDDLIAVITSWGPCVACAADVDGSGAVDADDLVTLILAWGPCVDCNGNGVADDEDLATGTGTDCNGTSVPDECELEDNDCNGNGVPDECDPDCNGNLVPDACELEGNDCDGDGVLDECQPPANETCGTSITVQLGTTVFESCPAATDGPAEMLCGGVIESDVWFRHLSQCDGSLAVALDADFAAVVAVYAGPCPDTDDEAIACDIGEAVFDAAAGVLYRFRVGSADGSSGSGMITLSCN